MGADGEPGSRGRVQSERAARLLDLLGLTEDELCATLGVDPLTLLSGSSITGLSCRSCPICWPKPRSRPARPCCDGGCAQPVLRGRPIDALTRRDFAAFEDALGALAERGFVLRGGGGAGG